MKIASALVAAVVMCAATSISAESGNSNSANATAEAHNVAKVEAVQRHVDAYRSGDIDRFVATFSTDAEVHANGMVARGHAEIRAFYALNFAPGAPSIRIQNSGMTGDNVFLSVGYVFESGEEVCCSYSEYEVSGGKIRTLVSSG